MMKEATKLHGKKSCYINLYYKWRMFFLVLLPRYHFGDTKFFSDSVDKFRSHSHKMFNVNSKKVYCIGMLGNPCESQFWKFPSHSSLILQRVKTLICFFPLSFQWKKSKRRPTVTYLNVIRRLGLKRYCTSCFDIKIR